MWRRPYGLLLWLCHRSLRGLRSRELASLESAGQESVQATLNDPIQNTVERSPFSSTSGTRVRAGVGHERPGSFQCKQQETNDERD